MHWRILVKNGAKLACAVQGISGLRRNLGIVTQQFGSIAAWGNTFWWRLLGHWSLTGADLFNLLDLLVLLILPASSFPSNLGDVLTTEFHSLEWRDDKDVRRPKVAGGLSNLLETMPPSSNKGQTSSSLGVFISYMLWEVKEKRAYLHCLLGTLDLRAVWIYIQLSCKDQTSPMPEDAPVMRTTFPTTSSAKTDLMVEWTSLNMRRGGRSKRRLIKVMGGTAMFTIWLTKSTASSLRVYVCWCCRESQFRYGRGMVLLASRVSWMVEVATNCDMFACKAGHV